MKRVLLLLVMQILAFGFAAGCSSTANDLDNRTYRTVETDPLRDTDAARKATAAGLASMDAGDLEGARKCFEKALAADVDFGPAHNNLGKVYYAQQKWHKAAWEFEYARKLMPRRAEPRNNIALVLEKAGELDEAIKYYNEAVSLDGKNIQYRANLARAMWKRGDRTSELCGLLEQILEKDIRPEWISWARQALASKFGS